jgi:hypothetical protein
MASHLTRNIYRNKGATDPQHFTSYEVKEQFAASALRSRMV